ncbi:hypothetical protein CK203_081555 [Vitis vinifera]|uniref:Uncharacterized protein n=1 Tax=Vitis vinifera TaxID=29760 RepID=A0A438E2J2_VITVI|nr:hypothetical protein CK203_081555 [Vitis vinifera]
MMGRYFIVVMMTLGGSRAIITLRAADRDRGGGTWAMTGCCDNVPDRKSAPCVLYRKIRMRVSVQPQAKKCLQRRKLSHLSGPGDAREKSIDKLSKAEGNAIIFSKEQFNAGSVPSSGVVQGIPPFLPDSTRLHPSQHSPGADGMQHYKHAHVCSPALPSIGDGAAGFDEGRGEGTCDGPGSVGGLLEHPARPFSPNYSTVLPDAKERHYGTLLTVRNLMASSGVPGVCRQHSPQEDAKGEEKKQGNSTEGSRTETQRRLPSKKAPAKKRKLVKNGKGVKEPTPPKEFVPPPITHAAEVIIRGASEPLPPLYFKWPRTHRGAEPFGALLVDGCPFWLLWLRKPASINHPGSPIRMLMQLRPFARLQWRKQGQKARVSPLTIQTVSFLFW